MEVSRGHHLLPSLLRSGDAIVSRLADLVLMGRRASNAQTRASACAYAGVAIVRFHLFQGPR